ncbi:hypothetical protein ASF44_22555 [Pseudorhodoferax sp. Leaf274]|nr:hypothetical protein ASF44_22555 [Pseudorhodoferax sp. Leaf274]
MRISQGWVRCGQCAEVFDAAQHLGEPEAASMPVAHAPAAPQSPPPLAPGQDVPLADDRQDLPPVASSDELPAWLLHAPAEMPVADPVASLEQELSDYVQAQPVAPALQGGPAAADVAAAGATVVPELHRLSAEPPAQAAPAERPGRLVVALAAGSMALPPLRAASTDAAMPLPQRPAAQDAPRPAPAPARVVAAPPVSRPVPPDPAHAELSFLRDAAPALPVAPRAAPRTRLLWSCAAGLAVVLLLWQWAVHERDRLAATAPGLRPLLGALCAPLGCSVQPLRRIDAIVIDGSAFQALGDNGYRLSLTLRNRAAHAVALPAIALTLTDIAEQPVVRRVLMPQDLGTPPAALDAHGEWTASADLQMADNAGRARVVGYRLDPFYP